MENSKIRLAISILELALQDEASQVQISLVENAINVLGGKAFVPVNPELTQQEIYWGVNHGKLRCVKEHKARTGMSLMDSKKYCEKYFEDNGFMFYQQSY